ncbi:MAG: response regulator, partial [Cyanobacteria bacterium J06636_16]
LHSLPATLPPFHSSTLPSSSSSATLCFEVEDTGPGIQADETEQLFDAFVQTEPGRKSQEGTGLGLPISREFVRLMGGELIAANVANPASNRGALFTFIIRVQTAEVMAAQTSTTARRVIALAPDQPKYRLLVVEDQAASRQLLVELLTSLGFEVRQAENGEAAIALWQSWHPHLIWMDIRMPVMDGYEATRRIKAGEVQKERYGVRASTHLLPHSPTPLPKIIALTASAFEEDRTAILTAGCDDFVRKPFQESVIFEKMTQHLGVRYVYAEDNQPVSRSRPQLARTVGLKLTADNLSVMSQEWLTQLHQAAVRVDADIIFQLLEQIPADHAPLAENLSDLTHRFCFDEIVELTQDLVD